MAALLVGRDPSGLAGSCAHRTQRPVPDTRRFVGYFYGANIAAEDLGATMVDARCSFGIHLDMNPGHVGFEFYNVAPRGQLGSLDHPLRAESEAEGTIPDMPDLVFRARRMVRGMGSTLFPRYVQRQARDFFYLTSRPLLPGSRIRIGPICRRR